MYLYFIFSSTISFQKLHSLTKTTQYSPTTPSFEDGSRIFAFEPLLSCDSLFCFDVQIYPQLIHNLKKKVYFITYHIDKHWMLVVLFLRSKNDEGSLLSFLEDKPLKGYTYDCIICDSDIDKDNHPSFTDMKNPPQIASRTRSNKQTTTSKEKFSTRKNLEEIKDSHVFPVIQPLHEEITKLGGKIEDTYSVDGMYILCYIIFNISIT